MMRLGEKRACPEIFQRNAGKMDVNIMIYHMNHWNTPKWEELLNTGWWILPTNHGPAEHLNKSQQTLGKVWHGLSSASIADHFQLPKIEENTKSSGMRLGCVLLARCCGANDPVCTEAFWSSEEKLWCRCRPCNRICNGVSWGKTRMCLKMRYTINCCVFCREMVINSTIFVDKPT